MDSVSYNSNALKGNPGVFSWSCSPRRVYQEPKNSCAVQVEQASQLGPSPTGTWEREKKIGSVIIVSVTGVDLFVFNSSKGFSPFMEKTQRNMFSSLYKVPAPIVSHGKGS